MAALFEVHHAVNLKDRYLFGLVGVIEEGMVLAFETYCGHGNDGARIEEQFVVTESGIRMLSKFPSQDLIACPCVGTLLP